MFRPPSGQTACSWHATLLLPGSPAQPADIDVRALPWSLQRIASGLLSGTMFAGCTSLAGVPARGAIHGLPVRTTVDSVIARDYLERYLERLPLDPSSQARIDNAYRRFGGTALGRDELATLSVEFSVDFAALFLVDSLLSESANRRLDELFRRHLADADHPVVVAGQTDTVLFVPGWDYAQNGHVTGADLAAPRRLAARFGLETQFVQVAPTGSVEENARFLADEISRHARNGRTLTLVGASSAGPAIHLALGELVAAADRRAVRAWLNLGGILQGTPLLDLMQRWPLRWVLNAASRFKGWDREALVSMTAQASRTRYQRERLDPRIVVVNYLGVPLSGQVSRFSRDKYPLLRAYGPNDGLTLLADAIAPNSFTIVALGRDHFLAEDPDIDRKTVALMKVMLGDEIEALSTIRNSCCVSVRAP